MHCLFVLLLVLPVALGEIRAANCTDDPNVDCSFYRALCDNGTYKPLLSQKCPVTCYSCGFCGDQNVHCPDWQRNGNFCNSTFYPPEEKQKCAKTCGLC